MPDSTPNEAAPPAVRVGHGWDLHRLDGDPARTPARPLVLAGVLVADSPGPVSHSDGDAAYHAVTDAILGAMALPDIGELFPNTDAANESADSVIFLAEAVRRASEAGYSVSNLDVTIVLERPKLGPFKASMRQKLAEVVGCPVGLVSVKAKSHERVDAVGEGRAVEAHAVVLLARRGG